MSKHTPGPWKALPEEVSRPYIRIRGTQLGCRYKVANVFCPNYENVSDREVDETRANARLIAAAPGLIEALELLLPFVTGNYWPGIEADPAIDKAQAIYKKALGES